MKKDNAKDLASLISPDVPGKDSYEYYRESIEEKGSKYISAIIGRMYEEGIGIKHDYVKAASWYEKAIKDDPKDVDAIYGLGNCYKCGPVGFRDYLKAEEWWIKGAKLGHDKSMYYLAILYVTGKGVDQDYDKAIKLLKTPAKHGDKDAVNFLKICKEEKKDEAKQFKRVFDAYCEVDWWDHQRHLLFYGWNGFLRHLDKLASNGDRDANYVLFAAKDDQRAQRLYTKKLVEFFTERALKGDGNAAASLGEFYQTKNSEVFDRGKAIHWLKVAADYGHPMGEYHLAEAYNRGTGVKIDARESFKYMLLAANHDIAPAQFMLSVYYISGHGTERNEKAHLEWLKRAVDQGFPDAEEKLGEYYYLGISGEPDYEKALQLFDEAACKGHGDAMFYLGRAYYDGCGVEKDYEMAYGWFNDGAWQGSARAKGGLAMCFLTGNGVKENLTAALSLFMEAADGGDQFSINFLKEHDIKIPRR